jgi:NAD(P)-dependent dehydrogenase (short-subunit alcohol dehydrogenase family)
MATKVALISGATGGIGSATARLFAREGAQLTVADLDQQKVDALVDELTSTGADVLGCTLDVTDESSWQAAVSATVDRFGHLDTLINVAGVVAWAGVEDTDQATWDRVIAINQTGTWLGMKVALPALRAAANSSVVNTSSVLGIVGGGGAAPYHASKGAVRLLSKTAAVEYATQGVRVNSIHPGVIATPMIQEILDVEGNDQRDIQRTPMKRAGTADEVAAGMLFLASDDASFVTGAELVIDGGLTAH